MANHLEVQNIKTAIVFEESKALEYSSIFSPTFCMFYMKTGALMDEWLYNVFDATIWNHDLINHFSLKIFMSSILS